MLTLIDIIVGSTFVIVVVVVVSFFWDENYNFQLQNFLAVSVCPSCCGGGYYITITNNGGPGKRGGWAFSPVPGYIINTEQTLYLHSPAALDALLPIL